MEHDRDPYVVTAAAELIVEADALLLDFDGPVASLMPPPVNALAAEAARAAIPGVTLPAEIATTTDHLAVLRYVLEHRSGLTAAVEHACTRAEVRAARGCSASAQAENLFAMVRRRGLPTAIVSNNSEKAVRVFLDRHGWTDQVTTFSCRDEHNAARMKPSPFLLEQALDDLGPRPVRVVFVGDSVSDVQAAVAAGVPVVGMAKNPRLGHELAAAGADAVTSLTHPLPL